MSTNPFRNHLPCSVLPQTPRVAWGKHHILHSWGELSAPGCSSGVGKWSETAWSSQVKTSGFAHKHPKPGQIQHSEMAPAPSWLLLVSPGGSSSGLVQGWQQSFSPSQGTDELPSPVVHKLRLLGISPRDGLVGGAGWTFF